MSKPVFVYVTYIASTPDKVFKALTSAETTAKFWFGNAATSDWKVGSPFALRLVRHEKDDVTGEVLEYDPPRRLSYSFRAQDNLDGGKASRVTFELEPQRDQVRLTMIHDQFEPGSEVLGRRVNILIV